MLKDYVCGAKGVNCSWGRAIAVADRYIYVTQPNRDRVLVISNIQMVVVDVSASVTSASNFYDCCCIRVLLTLCNLLVLRRW